MSASDMTAYCQQEGYQQLMTAYCQSMSASDMTAYCHSISASDMPAYCQQDISK